jgi:hypothetical protein
MSLCAYYQATVQRKIGWFFVGALRSFEHVCFDRTVDVANSCFEFFVPVEQEQLFVAIMEDMQARGVVTHFVKLPNRLMDDLTL